MTFEKIILISGGTLTGLLAGLFYAFSVAVVPALREVPAREHLHVMQAVNIKIKNPVFFVTFFGPSVLLPFAAYLNREESQLPLLVAASALCILGVNGVTIAGNLPLNDTLEKVDVSQLSESEAEQMRQDYHGFLSAWMRFHHLRTFSATAATVLIFIVCLSK